MFKQLLALCVAALVSATTLAADLVIAEKGSNNYQIVIPARSNGEIIDHWLLISAKLMQAAFEKNGVKIEVVKEDAVLPGKPGIYLGATEFAKKNGIAVEPYDDWTYHIKAAGRDLIIAGRDKQDRRSCFFRRTSPKGYQRILKVGLTALPPCIYSSIFLPDRMSGRQARSNVC